MFVSVEYEKICILRVMITCTHLETIPREDISLMTLMRSGWSTVSSVTCEQRLKLSCHTYCLFCGVDVPHNDCAEFESRGTRSSTVKSVLCMICCKYVSREESRVGYLS